MKGWLVGPLNTIPETNSEFTTVNMPSQRKLIFPPLIFQGYVHFREGSALVVFSYVKRFKFLSLEKVGVDFCVLFVHSSTVSCCFLRSFFVQKT